jgi:replicative DNA helicase
LGAIIIKPDTIHDVVDVIVPDSFYSLKHKIIWDAIFELSQKNEPIDLLSLSNILSEKNQIESIGGSAYLGELVSAVPSTSNIKNYADIVHKKSLMRKMIEAGERIKDVGIDEDKDVDEIVDSANKIIHDVSSMVPQNKVVNMKDVADETWNRLDHMHNSTNILRGIATGFQDIDNLLSGLQHSDLIILAARPSMGKTSLALDIARNVAVRGKTPVCIFSLEMAVPQLVDRMLAAEAKVSAFKLRTGKLNIDHDFKIVRDSLGALSEAPIYIDDQSSNNIVKIRAVARRLQRENKLGLIIIDYLQLMMPTNVKNDNLVQQITEISRSLKQLAKEFNVPVLALSQLSRAVESRGGRPRLSDLRDSGSIEQDADVVMFIHQEDKYNEENKGKSHILTEILIEKHRNGPTGRVQLSFDKDKSSFVPVEKADFGDFVEAEN